MEKQDQLKILSIGYISPEHNVIKKILVDKHRILHPPTINSGSMSTSRSKRTSSCNPIVSHEMILYPSLRSSSQILKKNRNAFITMMNTMMLLEKESHYIRYQSVMDTKRKLEYFRIHSKQSKVRDCRV